MHINRLRQTHEAKIANTVRFSLSASMQSASELLAKPICVSSRTLRLP
jgi:hypothetical protein